MPPKKAITKEPTKTTSKTPAKTPSKSSKTLVIVESPGKIKKIQSILGDAYIVTASVGHIIDLNSKTMSVDIENDFEPKYEYLSGKEKVIKDLKQLSSMCSEVLLATDEDREGEMIAWSLAYVLGLKNPKRITFNSITEEEILNAVSKPHKIDINMVEAQKARRILDRIVGYEISPILWKSIGQSLSAGRVQSVVVKLIIDREKEIDKFFSEKLKSYFSFMGKFVDKKKIEFPSILCSTKKSKIKEDDSDEEDKDNDNDDANDKTKKNGILKVGSKVLLEDYKEVKDIMKRLQKSKYSIQGIGTKESMSNPSAPFTTSTLQQEAASKLGFTIKRTMSAAQNLYEAGHITYMRTDSVSLSKDAFKQINAYVLKKYGKEYSRPKEYKGKSSNTQEAHEAVRPTHVDHVEIPQKNRIASDEVRLYQLIWKRTVASQMMPAIFNVNITQIGISELKDYYFSTEVKTIKFSGYLAVYDVKNVEQNDNKLDDSVSVTLPKVGENINYSKIESTETYQKPPPRFNEGMLVKKLDPDNLNIGRPSTYAAIITKIQEKEYVSKVEHEGREVDTRILTCTSKDIKETTNKIILGKDINKLSPTNMGKIVTSFLLSYFPEIMDYKFTATMETQLDKIAEGKEEYVTVLDTFYNNFHKIILNLDKKNIKVMDEEKRVIGKDPESGYNVVCTHKKYGPVVFIESGIGKPNMAPIKFPLKLETITLKQALELLSYPKLLGKYERKDVRLHRGKFGLYVKYGEENISLNSLKLASEGDLKFEQVVNLIKERMKKYLWSGKDGKIEYLIMEGPYGKFINVTDKAKKLGKPLNIKLPEETKIEGLTLERVKQLVEEGKLNKFKKKLKTKDEKEQDKKDDKKEVKKDDKKEEKPKSSTTRVAKTPTKKIVKK